MCLLIEACVNTEDKEKTIEIVHLYDAVDGETNLPLNKRIFYCLSKIKNKNSRSALNTISNGLGNVICEEPRPGMTWDVAAASKIKWSDRKNKSK